MGMESLIFGGLSAAGGLMSTAAAGKEAKANAQAAIMELQGQYTQVAIQNEQLLQEVDAIKIGAKQQINERYEQLQSIKENNRLAVSASGMSWNASADVADKVSDREAYKDVGMIEFNAASQRRNVSQQIKVNREALKYGGFRAATNVSNGYRRASEIGSQAALSTLTSLFKYAPPGTFK